MRDMRINLYLKHQSLLLIWWTHWWERLWFCRTECR